MAEQVRAFSVLGDNPIDSKKDDWLGFHAIVESLCGRLIDSLDNTPFTVGVLADWGLGKTSVMKLLRLELEESDCPTIWFEPWKYNSREEVWKGLVYNLVSAIRESDTLAREIKRKVPFFKAWAATALWSQLLGKHGEALMDAVQREPWSPKLLHDFESTVDSLFRQLYPQHLAERFNRPIVLFVDDLDRCLPSTALAVLEAMKLVLNRHGMIIVMGVAEAELGRAVTAAYAREMAELEERIDPDWGRRYIRKIFQLPFCIPPLTLDSLNNYVDHCLNKSGLIDCLGGRSKDWQPKIREACESNLREIKRFINTFISEMDKAAANAARSQFSMDPTLDAPRVFFIQLLARRFPEFYEHIAASRTSELMLRYQQHFLSAAQDQGDEAATRDQFEETDAAFHRDGELREFFTDCLQADEGEPLVYNFSDPLELLHYLQFGLSTRAADAASKGAGGKKGSERKKVPEHKSAGYERAVPESGATPEPSPAGGDSVVRDSAAAYGTLPGWVADTARNVQSQVAAGSLHSAERSAEKAIKRARSERNRQAEADLLARLSEVQQLGQNHGAAVRNLERELQLHEELGDEQAQINTQRYLAKSYRHMGLPEEAREAAARALQLAQVHEDLFAQINALSELIRSVQAMQNYEEAGEIIERLRAVAGQAGEDRALAEADLLLANNLRKQGRVEEAEKLLQNLLETCGKLGDRENLANALQSLALICEEHGDLRKAAQLRADEFEHRRRSADRLLELDTAYHAWRLDVLSGEPENAHLFDMFWPLAVRADRVREYLELAAAEEKRYRDRGEKDLAQGMRALVQRIEREVGSTAGAAAKT